MPGPGQREPGQTLAEVKSPALTPTLVSGLCPNTAFLSWAPDSSYPWVPPRGSPPSIPRILDQRPCFKREVHVSVTVQGSALFVPGAGHVG